MFLKAFSYFIYSIFKILFIICVAIFAALTITFFEDLKKSNRKKISFKEALDLTELPVVTFIGKGRKLNFLIDTGANNSILNESVANKMKLKCEEFDGVETNTAGGNINLNKIVNDYVNQINDIKLIQNLKKFEEF